MPDIDYLNQYQAEALQTAGEPDSLSSAMQRDALGLTGEAGEFAELIKKYVYHGHDLDVVKATKELGDLLWYVAVAASDLGVTLQWVAERNIAKLRERYPDGFSTAASIARVDVSDAPE